MTQWIVSGLYLKMIPPCRNKANKLITLRLNKVILCKVSNSVLQEQTSNYVTLNLDPGSWSKDWLQGRIWSFSSSKTSPRMFSWNSCIIGWRPYVFLKCWKWNTKRVRWNKSHPKSCIYWNLVSKPPIAITLQRRAINYCCHLHHDTLIYFFRIKFSEFIFRINFQN